MWMYTYKRTPIRSPLLNIGYVIRVYELGNAAEFHVKSATWARTHNYTRYLTTATFPFVLITYPQAGRQEFWIGGGEGLLYLIRGNIFVSLQYIVKFFGTHIGVTNGPVESVPGEGTYS